MRETSRSSRRSRSRFVANLAGHAAASQCGTRHRDASAKAGQHASTNPATSPSRTDRGRRRSGDRSTRGSRRVAACVAAAARAAAAGQRPRVKRGECGSDLAGGALARGRHQRWPRAAELDARSTASDDPRQIAPRVGAHGDELGVSHLGAARATTCASRSRRPGAAPGKSG